jgi:REP element-mobilizing transposase RayT
MPQSLSNVLLHVIFSTKDRVPFLQDAALREELHAYLIGTLRDIDCLSLKVGGVADHIHALCRLSRTMTIADLIEAMKTSSSKWVKREHPTSALSTGKTAMLPSQLAHRTRSRSIATLAIRRHTAARKPIKTNCGPSCANTKLNSTSATSGTDAPRLCPSPNGAKSGRGVCGGRIDRRRRGISNVARAAGRRDGHPCACGIARRRRGRFGDSPHIKRREFGRIERALRREPSLVDSRRQQTRSARCGSHRGRNQVRCRTRTHSRGDHR